MHLHSHILHSKLECNCCAHLSSHVTLGLCKHSSYLSKLRMWLKKAMMSLLEPTELVMGSLERAHHMFSWHKVITQLLPICFVKSGARQWKIERKRETESHNCNQVSGNAQRGDEIDERICHWQWEENRGHDTARENLLKLGSNHVTPDLDTLNTKEWVENEEKKKH